MICPRKNRIRKHGANDYASTDDFQRIFTQDVDRLYQLAFLLTGDDKKAERCLVAGLEDCVTDNRVFAEWARSWAKRTIIQNAIRELKPHPGVAKSVSSDIALSYFGRFSGGKNSHFELNSVLALEDFERFVFVMSVLEHYSDHDCALLLGSSRRDVEEARTRALVRLVDSGRMLLA